MSECFGKDALQFCRNSVDLMQFSIGPAGQPPEHDDAIIL
jgi:hypothetical protein